MKNRLIETQLALEVVFKKDAYKLLGALSALGVAAAFVLIPVYSMPGNDIAFQLSITPWWSYVFLALFSTGFGLMVPLQVYLYRHKRVKPVEKAKGLGAVLSSALSGVYATVACGGCVSTIFSAFGIGGVLFLTQYRTPLLALSVILLAANVHYSAKLVAGNCPECWIKRD